MISKVIKKPLLSEKSLKNAEENIYTFVVDEKAGKKEIALAVSKAFGVEVTSVKTTTNKGKRRRIRNTSREKNASSIKKAIISLKEGQKIEVFSRG